jgi:8-oxo-dGTP diphosphatase
MNEEKETTKKDDYDYFYSYIIKVLTISKIGLLFSKDEYAIDNYKKLEDLSMKVLSKFEGMKFTKPNYFSRDIYPTPNVSTRICIFNDKGEILLVKEKVEGAYSLPGGWCDLFDSPSEAAKNECIQEAGAKIKDIELIGIIDKTMNKSFSVDGVNSVPEYQLTFRASLDGEIVNHGYETSEVARFQVDKLPKMSHKCTLEDRERAIKMAKDRKVFSD